MPLRCSQGWWYSGSINNLLKQRLWYEEVVIECEGAKTGRGLRGSSTAFFSLIFLAIGWRDAVPAYQLMADRPPPNFCCG